MIHKPIKIKALSLNFPKKICFNDFTSQITYGSRIAIIGRNGSGKTTLLKIIQGMIDDIYGEIDIPIDVVFGFVPQVIEDFDYLSGGERLNKHLTQALSLSPNVLLLDEPTNHLDRHNRKSLIRMLNAYSGTLIVVSHDTELLRNCIYELWHIDQEKIRVFSGNYDDYMNEINRKRSALERELFHIKQQKQQMHDALMREERRAAKSRAKGEKSIGKRKWPTIVSKSKARRIQETSGRKKLLINYKKHILSEQLADLYVPAEIIPKFSISASDIHEGSLVSINNGSAGYCKDKPLLQDISISILSKDRIAIIGDNGSGKSTLIRAILNDAKVFKTGTWYTPKLQDIGYLDQHYNSLSPEKSVFESIEELMPTWIHADVRRHLNNFLFCKNEEISMEVENLSGGEKARLSLAKIAAQPPKLLILDEITNNLDLENCGHVIQVLREYPGAMIVISHDEDFLNEIDIETLYLITNGTIKYQRNNE